VQDQVHLVELVDAVCTNGRAVEPSSPVAYDGDANVVAHRQRGVFGHDEVVLSEPLDPIEKAQDPARIEVVELRLVALLGLLERTAQSLAFPGEERLHERYVRVFCRPARTPPICPFELLRPSPELVLRSWLHAFEARALGG